MAFGQYSGQYGGYGTPYTPGYYGQGQPMQDQLAQLRAGQYQMPQQGATQTAPGSGGIIWVQGEAGAKSYLVAPGNSVLLMDSETQAFYLKTADASGMPSMRTFDYRERVQQQAQAAPSSSPAEYVTRAEFDALAARLDGLTNKKTTKKTQEVSEDAEPAV